MDVLRRAASALAAAAIGVAPSAAAAGEGSAPHAAPSILAVTPALEGDRLVCRVATEGIPSERAAESMLGGLPSTVEFALALLDSRDRLVAESQVTFRLAFDLWEEVFRVDGGGAERRFETLEATRRFLADFERLPVAPRALLDAGARYRVRVALLHHAIAPPERSRVGAWIAGEADAGPGEEPSRDPDGREVSLSLGGLIRAVFGGARGEEASAAEGTSAWFRVEDLARAAFRTEGGDLR